jgi:hypothetical protein
MLAQRTYGVLLAFNFGAQFRGQMFADEKRPISFTNASCSGEREKSIERPPGTSVHSIAS